jgi:hypothetical protein
MIESEGLQERVQLVGAVPHEQAREFLVSSSIHTTLAVLFYVFPMLCFVTLS